MSWFYMGITNGYCPNSFRPPPPQTGKRGKKSAPNHPGKPLHPQATWEKSAPNPSGKPSHPQAMWGKNALNHSGKPLHPPFPFIGYAHMETAHFKNGLLYLRPQPSTAQDIHQKRGMRQKMFYGRFFYLDA